MCNWNDDTHTVTILREGVLRSRTTKFVVTELTQHSSSGLSGFTEEATTYDHDRQDAAINQFLQTVKHHAQAHGTTH